MILKRTVALSKTKLVIDTEKKLGLPKPCLGEKKKKNLYIFLSIKPSALTKKCV